MITQTLTPFDSSKQAIEGTAEFRANASYSWSWLIEHTNQQMVLINQINSTMNDMNSLAQTVTTKSQEVANNTSIVNQAKIDTQAARDAALNAKSAVESMTGLGLTGLANGDTLEYDSSISKFKNTNLHSKTAKTTPVDADEMMIADSATTFSLKKITWASIKTTIKTYLDTYFIPKITTPTTNVLAKIQADGTIKNSGVIEDINGNIGVNIGTPLTKMHIGGSVTAGDPLYAGSNSFIGAILNNNNTTPSLDIRRWNGIGTNHGVVKIAGNASGDMIFFSDIKNINTEATTERMRIDGAGNLLIGTSVTNGLDKVQIEGTFSSKAVKAFSGIDLNTLKTRTEVCSVTSTCTNIPIAETGFLEVFMFDSSSSWIMQRFTAIGYPNQSNQGRVFVRNWMFNNTWSPWVEK